MCSGKSGREDSARSCGRGSVGFSAPESSHYTNRAHGAETWVLASLLCANKVPEAPLRIFIKKVSVPQRKAGGDD